MRLRPGVAARARRVRLLVCDVDGVLTDGRMVLSERGDELKAFHTRDGIAIGLARRAGLLTALVTGMDRADLFKKVGKPSMSMTSMDSAKVIETCWYKNGAENVTVILKDGKVAEISGAETLAAK